jgi:TfoX/Sxy family transcriptional regulator of competence genes
VAYDGRLAARVRALLAGRADVSERKMFGGLTDMIGGNMCCGINGEELIVRLDPGREDDALASPPARWTSPGAGCAASSPCTPTGLAGSHLDRWVHEAVARAETLPPK